MNNIVKNILATVIAAGIIANFAVLWQFSDRMARIETKVEQIAVQNTQTAKKQHENYQ